ncbi:ARID DNA-binding domain-containing protein [Tanacetum coccineum]|uniref:ARID DNA-binding domain-containing protein n=1 Tax=Tanacetum coccineum TaxID=301880 RepID=A0ABQ4X511_9ASTR
MVNHNHITKKNWLQYKPVQHWYQSQGTENGMKPIYKHDQGGGVCKSQKPGKRKCSTQKEKRARCYKCKIRGHVFWKCPNKKKKIMNGKAQGESVTEDGLKDVVNEHNKFLDKYFESIEPKDEGSLVKGLEELEWDRKDVHDYMDKEYISWNRSLYSLKVNSFSRFLSFMNLMKEDSIVYKHWEIFSKKYVEMLKWFYLVYLNYDMLEKIPPVVGVMEINLLSLHKIVDSLGGYLCVTLGDKWKTVASIQGLTDDDDGEAIKGCYRNFIDMVQVYCETAKKTWFEKEPKGNVVGSSSGDARVKDPQGKDKDEAGKALEEDMNKKSKFGVSLEGHLEKEAEEGNVTDSNDLEVIIPPFVGVMEINLLSLHKIVDSLGGYLCVTLGDKWKTVASIQGLTDDDDGEAIKGCYRKFIDMVQGKRIHRGKDKDEARKALEEDMNKKSKFGVSLEGNLEKEAEEGSVTDSNDLEVIV